VSIYVLIGLPQEILDKFGMKNLKSIFTPLAFQYKLSDEQSSMIMEEKNYKNCISYAKIISHVIYVMVCTHSNIAYVECS